MEQNKNMLEMENMEINMEAINECLTPELPDSVAEFMVACVDKPY